MNITINKVIDFTEGDIERWLEGEIDLSRDNFKIKTIIPVYDGASGFRLVISIDILNDSKK